MIRRFVALLLALWFPVQALAALAMPYCEKHGAGGSLSGTETSSHHLTDHRDMPCAHSADSAGSDQLHVQQADRDGSRIGGAMCDQCGLCHLACAGYLIGQGVSSVCGGESVLSAREPLPTRSFTPDLFDRPPLARAA